MASQSVVGKIESLLQSILVAEEDDTDVEDTRKSHTPSLQEGDIATTPTALFEAHQRSVTQILAHCANHLVFGDTNFQFAYPRTIIDCVYSYTTGWAWTTAHDFVKMDERQRVFEVLHTDVRLEKYGTALVDGISIDEHDAFLFEFRYIAGSNMDAIIGFTDSRFEFKELKAGKPHGVGNMTDCFNWGLRFDGRPCWMNEYTKWETQICARWQLGDVIHIKVDTTVCQIWINDDEKMTGLVFADYQGLELPLSFAATAANGGGFEIIKGVKLRS